MDSRRPAWTGFGWDVFLNPLLERAWWQAKLPLRRTRRGAGFQTCCVADFQIGRPTYGTDAQCSNQSAVPGKTWHYVIACR